MTKIDYNLLRKGSVSLIEKVYSDLESKTVMIDETLPSIKAGEMPEYKKALESVKRYYQAVDMKIQKLGKKKN